MTLHMHLPGALLAMADITIDLLVYVIDTVDRELPVEVHQVDLLHKVLNILQKLSSS